MPDIKISQLNVLTEASDSDILVINDVSVSTTKNITFGNLLQNFSKNVVDSATGAKCTGDFEVENELTIGGDITTTATFNGADINADSVASTTVAADVLLRKSSPSSTGIDVGTPLRMRDGQVISFGTDNDLVIQHDGTNSEVRDQGTGSMLFRSDGAGFIFRSTPSAENNMASFLTGSTDGATVKLFHALGTGNQERLQTNQKGIGVTGRINLDADSIGEVLVVQDSSGSTRGVIAVADGDLYMGFGGAGLQFDNAASVVRPILAYANGASQGSGGLSDGITSLGDAASRFKDINLKEHLNIYNGTAPTGSLTNGVILYAEDVASSSELKVRDEAGNITTLSPHNFDLIPQGPSEDMAWSYYSEKDGRRINVDMLKAVRVLERLSGEQLVFED